MSDALSVTFNGNVTFQGPMFDIHDNGKVVINNVNDNVNDNKAGGNNGLPKELDTPNGGRPIPLVGYGQEALHGRTGILPGPRL